MLVHYLENSRAHRILWLLEELGLAYDVKVYKRGPDMRAPAELRQIHPLGKSPLIEDDGVVLAESGAMIEYLVETKGADTALAPEKTSPDYRSYLYWLHYAEGSAMPLVTQKLMFQIIPRQVPALIKPFASLISKGAMGKVIDPESARHLQLWEDTLSGSGYFVGNRFSAADIAMSFPVEAGYDRFEKPKAYPAIKAFLETIQARPAYQRALERGAPYMFAKKQ